MAGWEVEVHEARNPAQRKVGWGWRWGCEGDGAPTSIPDIEAMEEGGDWLVSQIGRERSWQMGEGEGESEGAGVVVVVVGVVVVAGGVVRSDLAGWQYEVGVIGTVLG
ncbi:hypothetical protein MBM_06184 [Drepanopeziza brunnea f. sp. 'multigermtubi' MB_m1]|uniref:Uncharacterized protein n=1 Tax=Marssonina brunnea f. sp. multigermtubi (strain MB_m1) TaxID=1072389 RepID=K1WR97_MARBU|nr:uncharacterized protein MBM_06184 [Drepanopeziza brunnea f. sp. 'multigermtubi' MB_m1]EKD15556.1 hypothetical protein MBM_06184 [Drepanopeziza brunnea f. sp. 'multigermtubi' MB_m1]